MPKEELTIRSESPTGEAAISWRRPRRDRLARAVVAVVACGLLMALWSILWVPPVPLH